MLNFRTIRYVSQAKVDALTSTTLRVNLANHTGHVIIRMLNDS